MALRKKTKDKLAQLEEGIDSKKIESIRRGINNRAKGHDLERKLVKFFKEELGFEFVKTTRNSSRILDSCGVDLDHIPFCISAKRGYSGNRPKADVLFKQMEELLKQNFPPENPIHNYPKILIHEIDGKHPYHGLVTMPLGDYKKLLILIKSLQK